MTSIAWCAQSQDSSQLAVECSAAAGRRTAYPAGAFADVTGTMVAYFATVVVNYGDFSRFTGSLPSMRRGNFFGFPVSLTFFTFLALFITAGSYIAFQQGEGPPLTNPAQIVGQVDSLWLTLVAAVTFFIATVDINLVANFVPPTIWRTCGRQKSASGWAVS